MVPLSRWPPRGRPNPSLCPPFGFWQRLLWVCPAGTPGPLPLDSWAEGGRRGAAPWLSALGAGWPAMAGRGQHSQGRDIFLSLPSHQEIPFQRKPRDGTFSFWVPGPGHSTGPLAARSREPGGSSEAVW